MLLDYYNPYEKGGQVMLYEVDFSIKTKDNFDTIQTSFIHAGSVIECHLIACEIAERFNKNITGQVNIFIEECDLHE
ncbi:hypothetical protein ACSVDA_21405 [Cytobacillus sp. Hm23]